MNYNRYDFSFDPQQYNKGYETVYEHDKLAFEKAYQQGKSAGEQLYHKGKKYWKEGTKDVSKAISQTTSNITGHKSKHHPRHHKKAPAGTDNGSQRHIASGDQGHKKGSKEFFTPASY